MLRSARDVRARFCEVALIDGGRRGQAVMAVLRRIPESDFNRLVALKGTFRWFLPRASLFGVVKRIPATHDRGRDPSAQIVYLGPHLEAAPWDVVINVAAHELAHVVLGHESRDVRNDADLARMEAEAYRLICRWGFEREEGEFRAHSARLALRDGAMSVNLWVDG
jgi:hypothetical protein